MNKMNVYALFFSCMMLVQCGVVDAMQKPDWEKEYAPLFEIDMVVGDKKQFLAHCNDFDDRERIASPQEFYNYLGGYRRTSNFFCYVERSETLFYRALSDARATQLLLSYGANIHRTDDIEKKDFDYQRAYEVPLVLLEAGAVFKIPYSSLGANFSFIDKLARKNNIKALQHLQAHEDEFFMDCEQENSKLFVRTVLFEKINAYRLSTR